jgi:hypothetical protein
VFCWIFPISLLACIIFLIRFTGIFVTDDIWRDKEVDEGFCTKLFVLSFIIFIINNNCENYNKMTEEIVAA